ncbi:MAG: DctP family TRAP transporter solute-binding subunit [Peptostreptococcaceae bacterium]|nr:DctP family TRAP transporter solute-binding subunit [Peptostreptococcaceae bacterium]
MKKKYLVLGMCLLVMALVFTGCGNNESENAEGEVETWKIAHSETTDTMYDLYANHFADLVEEKSEGRIQVDVYPVGTLGDTGSQVEMLMNGGIQFGIFASGDVGDMFPAVQALSLNFVFSDDDAVNAKVLSEGGATAALDEMFETQNMITYDWFSLGNMQWGSSKSIRTLDDFDGFKMRIMASPIIAANYEAFGASPVPMAFTETYSGLQLKTIEGTEQPINAMEEMKFYEVIDYITMSNHSQMASFMSMNSDFYNGLSDEDKALIEEIKPEMREFAEETLQELMISKLEMINTNKPELEIIELTDAQRQEFIDASLPVRAEIGEFGGDEAERILELLLADVKQFTK